VILAGQESAPDLDLLLRTIGPFNR
jgi:hypothetical protein